MPVGTADWSYIKRRWEEGLSAPAIEKEIIQPNGKPAVTRQAILKRANKEGWLAGSRSLTQAGSNVVPAAGSSEPRELAERWAAVLLPRIAEHTTLTPNQSVFIEALEGYGDGATHVVAAAVAGVSVDTWDRWRKAVPELEEAIARLRAFAALRSLRRIDRAAARGDWKADEALLKANPSTRGDWQADKGQGGGVAVQINFGAGMPAEALKVIDG